MSAKPIQPKTDRKAASPSDSMLESARERAISAYDSTRDGAAAAGRKARDQIGEAPLAVIAGGIAAGALIAALLPTSRRERDLLAPVTDTVKDRASAAVEAAKSAGQARLDELGLTRDAGGEAFRTILDGATDALKVSARAAATTVKGE